MSKIIIDGLSYLYPKAARQSLENVSLSVAAGAFAVLTGFTGSGKTTLCLAVAGAVPLYYGGAMAGQVKLGQNRTTDLAICEIAEQVGLVMQDYESQLVALTVEEEVAFGLENRGMNQFDIAVRVKEALALVGLAGKEERRTADLSGGQKQRLAIASVLATKPQILVLDEPASALDPEGTADLYRLLHRLNREQGMTILVVEHDLAQVLPYASQFVLLDSGKLEQAGSPAEVLRYMGSHSRYACCLPALWQIKLGLENHYICWSDWKTNEEAVRELRGELESQEAGKRACM